MGRPLGHQYSGKDDFALLMVASGLSATLIAKRPQTANEETTSENDQTKIQLSLQYAKRAVVTASRRKPLFAAIVHNQGAFYILQSENPDSVNHEAIDWRKRCFFQGAGCMYLNTVIKIWTGNAGHVTAFHEALLIAKTGLLEVFRKCTRRMLENLKRLMCSCYAQYLNPLRSKD
ncbi:hypothetical protein FVE85_6403 [Porphyridium purpureum]|uniref:Uncharacterized protein n=1 Tax=Porphyridium purpureum TaxID=35688 RepID=A0A5J4Z6G9_PORPP|nr:hypothetical protein FVE85_6403 [Porphyridium purpureum]|eukprot:POR8969..scf295_1